MIEQPLGRAPPKPRVALFAAIFLSNAKRIGAIKRIYAAIAYARADLSRDAYLLGSQMVVIVAISLSGNGPTATHPVRCCEHPSREGKATCRGRTLMNRCSSRHHLPNAMHRSSTGGLSMPCICINRAATCNGSAIGAVFPSREGWPQAGVCGCWRCILHASGILQFFSGRYRDVKRRAVRGKNV